MSQLHSSCFASDESAFSCNNDLVGALAGISSGADVKMAGVAEKCECPGKHRLTPFVTAHKHYECDVCRCNAPQGARMAGCRTCDFDVCHACMDTYLPGDMQ